MGHAATKANSHNREYLSVQAAADYLDLSPRTIRKLIADSKLEAFYVTPSRLRVRRSDIESYMSTVSTQRFQVGAA